MSKITELSNIIKDKRLTMDANISVCTKAIEEHFTAPGGDISQEGRLMQIYLETVVENLDSMFGSVYEMVSEFSVLENETLESRNALKDLKDLERQFSREKTRSLNANTAMQKERERARDLQSELDALKVSSSETELLYEAAKKKIEDSKAQLGELEALRKLNPHKMVSDHEREVNKLTKKIETLEKKVETAESSARTAKVELRANEEEMARRFGKRLVEKMPGREGIQFRLTHYNYPSEFEMQVMDDIVPLLHNLGWHLRVNSTDGLSVDVSLNTCLVPIFPFSTEMKDTWPEKLTDEIQAHLLDVVKHENPELLLTRKRASQLYLTTHPKLNKEEQEALKKAKLITLLDVAGQSFASLKERFAKTKKLPAGGEDTLYKKLQAIYIEFAKEGEALASKAEPEKVAA